MNDYSVYHSYSEEYFKPPKISRNIYTWGKAAFGRMLTRLAVIFAILAALVFVVTFAPSLWYSIRSGGGKGVSTILFQTIINKNRSGFEMGTGQGQKRVYQPRFDPNLPAENKVKIVSAGIDTEINEATAANYEEALKKGVWRVNDYGTPEFRDSPLILVAHRFGYLRWSIPYRLKNSFYNLTKLKVGDTIEVDWKQRKYIYEVYREAKGEEIDDYAADLILYTCESLNSPVRIFKYARLLEI